jgi:hypothetical protein
MPVMLLFLLLGGALSTHSETKVLRVKGSPGNTAGLGTNAAIASLLEAYKTRYNLFMLTILVTGITAIAVPFLVLSI